MVVPIYLMYELEKREFLARLFLASEMISSLNSKIYIHIFQHSLLGVIATTKKPGIIIIKSCPIQYYPFLETMKKRGFTIFLSQEEGVHYSSNLSDQLEFSRKCAPLVNKYFAWHSEDALFAKKMGIPVGEIVITGSVRFQLAYRMRSYSQAISKDILILENFGSTDMYSSMLQKNRKVFDAITQDHLNVIDKMSASIKQNHILYEKFYKSLTKVNLKFKIRKYTLVSKSDFKNSKTFQRTNILQDLSDKNFVVHYGSTAGLEAILAGKISLVLANLQSRVYDRRIYEVSKTFESSNDLISYLMNFNVQEILKINAEQLKKLENLYETNYETLMPSKLILDVMTEYIENQVTSNKVLLDRFIKYCLYSKNKFLNLIRRILRPQLYSNLKAFKLSNMKVDKDFQFLNIDLTNLTWKICYGRKSLEIYFKN